MPCRPRFQTFPDVFSHILAQFVILKSSFHFAPFQ